MQLCDNIFSLSIIMTRVEKYRRYREEISNMKIESFTSKKNAATQVERFQADGTSKLNLEQIMEVHEAYDNNDEVSKKKNPYKISRFETKIYVIAFSIIAIILIALILTGIKLRG